MQKWWRTPLAGAEICFLATSKSGLGHLRRTATIARAIRSIAPDRVLRLVSNALPDGLEPEDLEVFASVHLAERGSMTAALPPGRKVTLVLDTITVPGIESLAAPLALVLREAPTEALYRFRLAGGRPWDQVIVANPHDHWTPDAGAFSASAVTPVGWIYRLTGARRAKASVVPTVLVATGGGGTAETARAVYSAIDDLLSRVSQMTSQPFQVVQAVGPRGQNFGLVNRVDRVVDPGGRLNDLFRDADIVISTAGYNSVLELATTDTPTLLVPIPRSIDDQVARAKTWAPQLGAWHDAASPNLSAEWLSRQIAERRRRPPVDLGPSGEHLAATAILRL
jgi:predicted glycosyltransferase